MAHLRPQVPLSPNVPGPLGGPFLAFLSLTIVFVEPSTLYMTTTTTPVYNLHRGLTDMIGLLKSV